MNKPALVLAMAFVCNPLAAQERHPLVSKVVVLRVAARVVSDKCKGWSLNPAVGAMMSMSIGFAGLHSQVERIDEAEIARIADSSVAENWQPGRVAEQCGAATRMTIPNPLNPGESLPLFVQAE